MSVALASLAGRTGALVESPHLPSNTCGIAKMRQTIAAYQRICQEQPMVENMDPLS
jgi:hypothetical protein